VLFKENRGCNEGTEFFFYIMAGHDPVDQIAIAAAMGSLARSEDPAAGRRRKRPSPTTLESMACNGRDVRTRHSGIRRRQKNNGERLPVQEERKENRDNMARFLPSAGNLDDHSGIRPPRFGDGSYERLQMIESFSNAHVWCG